MDSLKEFFRPEFLNRIDDIVVFDILTKEAIKKIVEIQVNQVKERLSAKEIMLDISSEVYEYLAKEGYSPQYGARPLKRLIQNKILTPVASMIISKGIMKGGVVTIGIGRRVGGRVVNYNRL
jgi:ATP-dependent Clp protease ATP-binding subunit ClpB